MKLDNVREVTLPEVVQRTLSVVVAKPLGDVKTKISVGSDLPEFVRVDGKWEVTEVIVDETAKLKRGSKILVHDANAAVRLRVHRELHRSGTARQFLTHRYQPIAEPAKKEPRILFLRQGDGAGWPDWAYAIEGAAEGLDAMHDVRAALVPKFGAAVAPKAASGKPKAKPAAAKKKPAANGKKKKR
jgi:hypothetical protein